MTWPAPQPGLVIRYAYLWRRETEAGREEGVKDRPCAVVVAIENAEGGKRVIVLPITHVPPQPPDEGVTLPDATKMRLGLDGEHFWIIVSEANDFIWPGPDLRPLPRRGPSSAAYGFLPPGLFRVVRERFIVRARQRMAAVISRTQ